MGSIRARKESGNLVIDFQYHGLRCREQTLLKNSPANVKKLETLLNRIEAAITLDAFDYESYFPGSKNLQKFRTIDSVRSAAQSSSPNFGDFAEVWYAELQAQWRSTHKESTRRILDLHLLPTFKNSPVDSIKKADILAFRAKLVSPGYGNRKRPFSASRINHILTPLRMILNEAADRFEFPESYKNIAQLKVPKADVRPFTFEEVNTILESVRQDYRHYYCVRFFTGLRTSEIDGLQWKFVDFERKQLLIQQALVNKEMVYTKNDGSYRAVDMSTPVYDALKKQHLATGNNEFVFCNTLGNALSHNDVTKKVWHPLLRSLNLPKRRPYQTRHTAATLWLASGESPEWIARQMGHSSTEMLFKVYSRYVPNLTRQDGSAFERLLETKFTDKNGSTSHE